MKSQSIPFLIKDTFEKFIKPSLLLSKFQNCENEFLYYEKYWAHLVYSEKIKTEHDFISKASKYIEKSIKYRKIDLIVFSDPEMCKWNFSNNHLSTNPEDIKFFLYQMETAFTEFKKSVEKYYKEKYGMSLKELKEYQKELEENKKILENKIERMKKSENILQNIKNSEKEIYCDESELMCKAIEDFRKII